jgi:hypothetical protein
LDRLVVQIDDPGRSIGIDQKIEVEFFDGGEWKGVGGQYIEPLLGCSKPITDRCEISLKNSEKILARLPYGKYRLKARVCGSEEIFQYSNEFYFKRE